MKSRLTNTASVLGIVVVCLSHTAQAQVADRIFGAKGVPTSGTIVRMTNTTVYLETGGAERPFKIEEIRKVTFADEPTELDRARDYVIASRYNDAVTELKKIDRDNVKLDFINKDIQFYFGLCAAKLSQRGEFQPGSAVAIDFVKKFVDDPENKNNYHYFEAVEALADLLFGTGDFVQGEARYTVLFNAPGESKIRARVRVGECQLGQEKYTEAKATFGQVTSVDLSSYPTGLEQQAFAKIGTAVCVAAGGDANQGITLIEDIIRKEDPKNMALFGRAYNAMGNCYLKANKPKDALLAFLHTDILFYGDSNAHAEALFHLSRLWETENRQDRALRARETLKSRYSGTIWQQKAG